MQLLVSVRSAAEVEPALVGGADIVDAKEPSRGSLGAVAPDTLAEILTHVPTDRPFSVALGDLDEPREVIRAIDALGLPDRRSPTYLKLGFAGVRSPVVVRHLIGRAVAAVAGHPTPACIVAVAYADNARAGTLPPEYIIELAHSAGAAGVLLDTHIKDGGGLLRWRGPGALRSWVSSARRLGLGTALAGELGLAHLDAIHWAGPDILGVRGAVCEGGREGQVTAYLVRALRQGLDTSASVSGTSAQGVRWFAKRPRRGGFLRPESA